MSSGPPIILTTDFGSRDAYVGVMKGVIRSINPRAGLIDLTHEIQPQNLNQASFLLGTSYRYFPQDSIHVVVVDPGVGTHRNILLLVTPAARFLAPDNGVLSWVLGEHLIQRPTEPSQVAVPESCSAYAINNPKYWLHPLSSTFHGRDIFAPVAAHLSLGVSPELLGDRLDRINWLSAPLPIRKGDLIRGEIIYTDHFGNLITNIPGEWLGSNSPVAIRIKGYTIPELSRTFNDQTVDASNGLVALVGSQGFLEVAVRNGSAALALSTGVGEPVQVELPQ